MGLDLEKKINKLEQYFKFHRIVTYLILFFLFLITILLIIVANQVKQQQAFTTDSQAAMSLRSANREQQNNYPGIIDKNNYQSDYQNQQSQILKSRCSQSCNEDGDCQSGLICYISLPDGNGKICRSANNPTDIYCGSGTNQLPTPTTVNIGSCNKLCVNNGSNSCGDGMICRPNVKYCDKTGKCDMKWRCRNESNPTEENCYPAGDSPEGGYCDPFFKMYCQQGLVCNQNRTCTKP